MFNWIRSKVKNAILAGFADAVEHLQATGGGANNNDDAEQRLAGLLGNAPAVEVIEAKSARSNGKVKVS